jgi:MinD superfamily P-loop ATPase
MSTKNKDMSKNNCDDCFTKRLVIITGDKGGVGKSTLSRALLHFYTSKEIPCIAFECDTRNPQLEVTVHRIFLVTASNRYKLVVD